MTIKTIRELRQSLAKALETASKGEQVEIFRGKERFLLVSEDAIKKARSAKDYRQEYTEVDVQNVTTTSTGSFEKVSKYDNLGELLEKIKIAQADKAAEVDYCQDAQEKLKIGKRWDTDVIQPLWREYHELKET